MTIDQAAGEAVGSAAVNEQRTVTLLGATGSIGASTLDLIKRAGPRYKVVAVCANRNVAGLAELARDFDAEFAAIGDPTGFAELRAALSGTGIEVGAGENALVEAAQRPAEWVLAAITGAAGLKPTLAAADRGAIVALANKETLVCAGDLFMRRAAASGATVLPVDSEHNALFQAMCGSRREDVRRIILTASGGPFRTADLKTIETATVGQALKHPNWSMGPKVTIDSATMMNKGLELIEAHHLFGLNSRQIDILVHPQSIVHSLVEYCDGSVIAQLGNPDMRIPISYCLGWPRGRLVTPASRLDLARLVALTFEEPDPIRFPALSLARNALEEAGAAPTVLNAVNEVAVGEFLAGSLSFPGIIGLVERVLDAALRQAWVRAPQDIEEALFIDHNTRLMARDILPEIAAKAS
ncbi:MAG TPA: 1-deoxy-D-xylulose-5-phosphate reductoisomerase [Xanthobacteraceae bacterium]|jgi:1-deoxy-D-xylulose-5-phosphate reductoisomerase